jgi:hypothetical protein
MLDMGEPSDKVRHLPSRTSPPTGGETMTDDGYYGDLGCLFVLVGLGLVLFTVYKIFALFVGC